MLKEVYAKLFRFNKVFQILPRGKKNRFWIILDASLRIAAVALMWWNVLYGFLANGLLDAVDGDILAEAGVPRNWYQKYDKLLDNWWYVAIFVYTVLYLPRDFIWYVLVVSFFVRIFGSLLFTFTNKEWLLFVFPGLFNWLFFFRIAFPFVFTQNMTVTLFFLGVLSVFTLWREWQLHIAKIDMTHFLFPFKPEKSW